MDENEILARCDVCNFINYLSVVNDHVKKNHRGNQPAELTESHQNQEIITVENITGASANTANTSTVTSGSFTDENNSSWNEPQTRLLLDKYEEYMDNVGPMKKFKTKKIMWQNIGRNIRNILGVDRTGPQCENRYKTIMKRKNVSKMLNSTSGETPHEFIFDAEVSKIANKDDNIQPEILMDLNNIIVNKKERQREKKHKQKSVVDTLWDIHKEKERAKERRHKEKLALLKEIGIRLTKEAP